MPRSRWAGIPAAGFAMVAGLALCGCVRWQANQATFHAGFWYEDFPFRFPDDAGERLGGPLQPDEIETIKRISRDEVVRAFTGYRVTFSENRRAFWRVSVIYSMGRLLPSAGETISMGRFGGSGQVAFAILASNALLHAPPGASRQAIIEGLGRGIGRAAVHEYAHQILGLNLMQESTDEQTYECNTANRAAQYYGELHWSTALAGLERRIGKK